MAKLFNGELVKAVATGLVSAVVPMIVEQAVKDYQSYQKYLADKHAAEEERFNNLRNEINKLSQEIKYVRDTRPMQFTKKKVERERHNRTIKQNQERVDRLNNQINGLVKERDYRLSLIRDNRDDLKEVGLE